MCNDSAKLEEVLQKINTVETKTENIAIDIPNNTQQLQENIQNYYYLQALIQNNQAANNYINNLNALSNLIHFNNLLSQSSRNPFFNNENINVFGNNPYNNC